MILRDGDGGALATLRGDPSWAAEPDGEDVAVIVEDDEAPDFEPSRLTDDEADYLLRQFVDFLRDRVPEVVFHREFGRGVLYGPSEATRGRAREWVRLIARGEG